MILDSEIWKNEIENQIKTLKSLLKNMSDGNIEDDNTIIIELQKFTVFTAIIIRKLIEANKISEELMGKNFSILKYNKNDKNLTILNGYEIESLYDLNSEKMTSISLKNISQNIIHSFHFIPFYHKNEINNSPLGFYLSSDFTKENEIYLIMLDQYLKILNEVIADFITYGEIANGKIVKQSNNQSKNNEFYE